MRLPPKEYKRVLLIDQNPYKQHLRSAALRNCEIKVDTANGLPEAESYWTKFPYDLVLLSAEENSVEAVLLCQGLKQCKYVPRVALLVGAPQFVREIGAKRKISSLTRARTVTPITEPMEQPSQWDVMMTRLMAAS